MLFKAEIGRDDNSKYSDVLLWGDNIHCRLQNGNKLDSLARFVNRFATTRSRTLKVYEMLELG